MSAVLAGGLFTSSVTWVVQQSRICLPMQETRVQSLGWEDPLKKEVAMHSSILAWEIPWTEESGGASVHGFTKESDTT